MPLRLMDWCETREGEQLFEDLCAAIPWNDGYYLAAGRRFMLPRRQSWHADPGVEYCYAENLCNAHPWNAALEVLRTRLQRLLGIRFNAVLANLYRNGGDHVGWHADDEPDLGPAPLIASLSLGATREFCIRNKLIEGAPGAIHRLRVPSTTLLVMDPPFQRDFEHAVLAEPASLTPRLNLTFRYICGVKAA